MSEEKQNMPVEALMARHEQPQDSLDNEDIKAVAGLFQRVGSELHTIDHHYVGGNSNTRALQLQKEKVFNAKVKQGNKQPASPAPSPNPQPAPVTQPTAKPPETDKKLQQAINRKLSGIEARLTKLEKVYKEQDKIKFPVYLKSKAVSITADNFEELSNALRTALAKSEESITISVNED